MNFSQITIDSIVERNSSTAFSKLDDDILAIDSQAGYCYSLNETAGRIWDLIVTPLSVRELCSRLTKEFSVDDSTCRQEVTALLQQLFDSGLIQVKDASAPPA